jgi:hypothetical protein
LINQPTLHNREGDEVVFHEVTFPLAPAAATKEVACRLDDLRIHMAMARAEGRASPELSRPPDGQNTQLRGHWAISGNRVPATAIIHHETRVWPSSLSAFPLTDSPFTRAMHRPAGK